MSHSFGNKGIDKYAQMKRFHCDLLIQVYMYDFMNVNPESMVEEEYFQATKYLLKTKRKIK